MSLTVSDDRFDAMLASGEIELAAELSDSAIEKMRYNRGREFYHPEMEYLDGEPFVEKFKTYSKAGKQARSRLRRVELSLDDEADAEELEEILCVSAVKLFSLMKPLLKHHEYWEEIDMDYPGASVEGLKQIEAYEEKPRSLHPEDAFVAVQEIRTAAVSMGLLHDISDEIREARESVEFWLGELEELAEK
jgi:hypothetical protein